MASPPLSFQTSASLQPRSGDRSPSLRNLKIEDPLSQEETQPISLKKRYADKAQELGIIDRAGAALGTRINKKTVLEKSDQVSIKESWKKPCRFSEEGFNFQWTFDQTLSLFVPYFVKTYKGTTIQMIQGVFHTLGKSFWQKQTDAAADSFITHEMWNFCTQTPPCYEFWVRLPPSDSDLCKEELLKQFQDLLLYFVAAQALPMQPDTLGQALHQFDSLRKETTSTEKDPSIKEVKEVLKTLQQSAKTTLVLQDPIFKASVEIPCGDGSFLKVSFANYSPESACFRLDDFRLEIGTEDITLACPSNPWEAFNDHLIHRLVLSQSQPDARALGMYWAHSVLEGGVFQREKLESALIKENKSDAVKSLGRGHTTSPPWR